jgi:hypothetical protein
MERRSSLKYWRTKKRPRDGQSNAKSGYCLTYHWHQSGLEIKTCDELRLRKIAGDILDYETQKRVKLELGGHYLGSMYVDFLVHETDGTFEFLESKGIAFAKWKRDWPILQVMYKDRPEYKFRVVYK